MSGWLVRDAILRQVGAHHIGLDLHLQTTLCTNVADGNPAPDITPTCNSLPHLIEGFPVVHADDRPNHLGQHDHVAEVRAHRLRLLACRRVLLGLAKLLDERERLALQAPLESAKSGTSLCITSSWRPPRAGEAKQWLVSLCDGESEPTSCADVRGRAPLAHPWTCPATGPGPPPDS